MKARTRAAIVALASSLTCGWLGTQVSEAPPAGIDLAGRAVAGFLPHVALVFTASCWWQYLVGLGAAALVLAEFDKSWRPRVFFSLIVTVVGWQASDLVKLLFRRSRPDYWLLHPETTWAYPSGHAMFATIVFGLWSYFWATSDVPRAWRIVLSTGFALWGIGVIWSRLALGAHYVTDLCGGVLFGITILAIGVAAAGELPRLRHVQKSA